MTYTMWKAERYLYNQDAGWSATATQVTSFYEPQVTLYLANGKNSFSFNAVNFNNRYNDFFHPNDKVVISRVVNTTSFTDTDKLIVGVIKDNPYELTYAKNTKTINGCDFSDLTLETPVYIDFTTQATTVPYAIKACLDNASITNPQFKVYWSKDNPLTKSDGTSFPLVSSDIYRYKLLKDALTRLSSNVMTGEDGYKWYIDNSPNVVSGYTYDTTLPAGAQVNTLVWRHPNSFDTSTFNSHTNVYRSLKYNIDVSGIKNFYIIAGGLDPNNTPINGVYMNPSSVANFGLRFQYVVSQNNQIGALIAADQQASFNGATAPDKYPNITASSFQTTWKSAVTTTVSGWDFGTVNMTAGQYVVINLGSQSANKKAYVKCIRAHMQKVLRDEGQSYAQRTVFGIIKVDIEFKPGDKNWQLANVITCNIPEIRTATIPLRVFQIQYTNNSDIFSLEEDIGSFGSSGGA